MVIRVIVISICAAYSILMLIGCTPRYTRNPLVGRIKGGTIRRVPFNSQGVDYGPSVSADGKRLYYVSNRSGSMNNATGVESHDMWHVDVLNDSATLFSTPFNSDTAHLYGNQSLNTKMNEGVGAYCASTNEFIVTGCNREGGKGDCDLYRFLLQPDGTWSIAEGLKTVNTGYWESQPTVSPDGLLLVFCSNRPAPTVQMTTDNEQHLWYSVRSSASDEWGEPAYLGEANKNTKSCGPFLTPDGKSLIFSAEMSGGLGGLDYWIMDRDSTGKWQTPQNMGAPLNSAYHDMFLTMPLSGNVIYFTSTPRENLVSAGGLDIFQLVLPPAATVGKP